MVIFECANLHIWVTNARQKKNHGSTIVAGLQGILGRSYFGGCGCKCSQEKKNEKSVLELYFLPYMHPPQAKFMHPQGKKKEKKKNEQPFSKPLNLAPP